MDASALLVHQQTGDTGSNQAKDCERRALLCAPQPRAGDHDRQHQQGNQKQKRLVVPSEIPSTQSVMSTAAAHLFPRQKKADDDNDRSADVGSSQD